MAEYDFEADQRKALQCHDLLNLYYGECGHRWVGASGGSYACPVCGLHDGDHHLTAVEPIPVQVEDWGMAWSFLVKASDEAWAADQQQMKEAEEDDRNFTAEQ